MAMNREKSRVIVSYKITRYESSIRSHVRTYYESQERSHVRREYKKSCEENEK